MKFFKTHNKETIGNRKLTIEEFVVEKPEIEQNLRKITINEDRFLPGWKFSSSESSMLRWNAILGIPFLDI